METYQSNSMLDLLALCQILLLPCTQRTMFPWKRCCIHFYNGGRGYLSTLAHSCWYNCSGLLIYRQLRMWRMATAALSTIRGSWRCTNFLKRFFSCKKYVNLVPFVLLILRIKIRFLINFINLKFWLKNCTVDWWANLFSATSARHNRQCATNHRRPLLLVDHWWIIEIGRDVVAL